MAISIRPSQASQMTAYELHAKSHHPAVADELGRRLALIDNVMNDYGGGFVDGFELNPQQLTALLDRIEHILN